MALLVASAACGGRGGGDDGTDRDAAATSAASRETSAGAEGTARPGPTPPGSSGPPPAEDGTTGGTAVVRPDGFDSVTVRVTAADGSVCEVCTWLADTIGTRGRGLMGVTDLDGRAGMAFSYAEPTTQRFFMFSTLLPLSIAWFAADGAFVSAVDMDPCPAADAAECRRYSAAAPYVLAIEVPQGGLDELGIGPGSSAVLVPGTRGADCAEPG